MLIVKWCIVYQPTKALNYCVKIVGLNKTKISMLYIEKNFYTKVTRHDTSKVHKHFYFLHKLGQLIING